MVELVQLLIAGVIWGVIWGSLCAWLAGQKGRDGTSWFILGFFFALIALIVLGFSPSADAIPSDTTTCPRCAETIKSAAVVCRFCGYEPPRTSAGQRTDEQPHPCWCDVIKGDHDIRDHPHHQSDAPTIGASRRSTRNSPWPAAPNYSGDWRVLVAEADGLTAGDDVTLVVDDGTLRILKADVVAYELSVSEVTGTGSASEIRLALPGGQTILLDWWAGDDGRLLRSALRTLLPR